jgi:hypothetical protein
MPFLHNLIIVDSYFVVEQPISIQCMPKLEGCATNKSTSLNQHIVQILS